ASRSVRAAINACFSTRRCNCQTPSPTQTATIASVKTPKPMPCFRSSSVIAAVSFGDKRDTGKYALFGRHAAIPLSLSFRPAVDQPARRGLVVELERNQECLHRAQRQQRGRKNQRQPEHSVQPERRLILDL